MLICVKIQRTCADRYTSRILQETYQQQHAGRNVTNSSSIVFLAYQQKKRTVCWQQTVSINQSQHPAYLVIAMPLCPVSVSECVQEEARKKIAAKVAAVYFSQPPPAVPGECTRLLHLHTCFLCDCLCSRATCC